MERERVTYSLKPSTVRLIDALALALKVDRAAVIECAVRLFKKQHNQQAHPAGNKMPSTKVTA